MDRQQILDLYEWAPGTCFRHPDRGEMPTALVKVLHPRGDAEHEVRACEDCVVAIEDARREMAARSGSAYEPGHAGEPSPSGVCPRGEASGERLSWGESGE